MDLRSCHRVRVSVCPLHDDAFELSVTPEYICCSEIVAASNGSRERRVRSGREGPTSLFFEGAEHCAERDGPAPSF
jgi:hypothetical protein